MTTGRIVRAYDSRIRRIDSILNFSDTDFAVAATTLNLDRAAFLLPADALLVGTALNVATAFTDGATGTLKVDLGISGSSTIYLVGATNNLGAATGRINGGTAGAQIPGFVGATQVRMTFTSNVNLATMTAGKATITLLYTRIDFQNDAGRGYG